MNRKKDGACTFWPSLPPSSSNRVQSRKCWFIATSRRGSTFSKVISMQQHDRNTAVFHSALSQHLWRSGAYKLSTCVHESVSGSVGCAGQGLSSAPSPAACSCRCTQRRFSAPLSPSRWLILYSRTSSPASTAPWTSPLWPEGEGAHDCSWENKPTHRSHFLKTTAKIWLFLFWFFLVSSLLKYSDLKQHLERLKILCENFPAAEVTSDFSNWINVLISDFIMTALLWLRQSSAISRGKAISQVKSWIAWESTD